MAQFPVLPADVHAISIWMDRGGSTIEIRNEDGKFVFASLRVMEDAVNIGVMFSADSGVSTLIQIAAVRSSTGYRPVTVAAPARGKLEFNFYHDHVEEFRPILILDNIGIQLDRIFGAVLDRPELPGD